MKSENPTQVAANVARVLLELGTVSFDLSNYFEFVSGIKSPVYIDNRKLISYPDARRTIVGYFLEIIREQVGQSSFDIIAGTATAGITWSAWIAHELDLPLIYVRPEPKKGGLKRQIEGVLQPSQRAIVIEDLITTGLSSCNVADSVRAAGGVVDHCVSIFSFDSLSSIKRFRAQGLNAHPLTNLSTLLMVAEIRGYLSKAHLGVINDWANTALVSYEL